MDIGFIGLGKLGLPTALAVESCGHSVYGCDPSPEVAETIKKRRISYKEADAQELLERSRLVFTDMAGVVRHAYLIFVTIQTPHDPRYEGVTRLPEERRDFDYSYLEAGMRELSSEVERLGEERIIVIVSTVLPGTIRKRILPLCGPHSRVCYNPFFIAMGTAIKDFLDPEFVLFGVTDEVAAQEAERFYKTITNAPFFKTTIENAEIIKVLYNTFISTKLAFVNTAMELCHKIPGTNVDTVCEALKLGNRRLFAPSYFTGGMGDGGGCHPRDNIALSYLSRELGLSFDWFENIMLQRERQTEWFADLIQEHANGREILLMGKSFKPESNILLGSPALLLRNILVERGKDVLIWDPYVDEGTSPPSGRPFCYFIATRHREFRNFPYEPGSVVIDPWRYVEVPPQVELIRIGG